MTKQEYTYAEHRFRFAAWAAARAVIPNSISYPPKKKLPYLERSGALRKVLVNILREVFFDKITGKDNWQLEDEILEDNWLLKISNFEIQHKEWRNRICELAKGRDIFHGDNTKPKEKGMSHGQAAKLINVFIKALMPSDMDTISSERKKLWCEVHPPIDSILLKGMDDPCNQCPPPKVGECKCGYGCRFVKETKWEGYKWTQLGPCDYENLIENIKNITKRHKICLWEIERFWIP